MADGRADRYWAQFIRSLPPGAMPPPTYLEAFRFGTTREAASEIATLVVAGTKTSTASVKWVHDAEGRPLMKPGDLSIVLDGHDQPVCIIETTEVKIVAFDEMLDEQFASDGGEGDRTLESWRRMYWQCIRSECARLKREPTAKTPLVCERFRVVYREPLGIDARVSDPFPPDTGFIGR